MLRMKYSKSTMWIQSESLTDETLESKMSRLWAFTQQIFLSESSILLLPIPSSLSHFRTPLLMPNLPVYIRSLSAYAPPYTHILSTIQREGANISLKKQKAHLCCYSICHVSIHAITCKEKAKEYYYNSNAGLEEVKGRLLAKCV